MDILAIAPTGEEFLIDSSIRNPLAQRYSQSAFSLPGRAADVGEYDKKSRYPTTQGKAVLPCVMESFGRLGKDFHAFLEHLAYLTSGIRECDATRPSQLRNNWLLDISATINKAIAKNYRIACAGSHAKTLQLVSLFPPEPPAPPSFFSAKIQNSPLSSTVHNRFHILSSFIPTPSPSFSSPSFQAVPTLTPLSSPPAPPVSTKPAAPKRTLPGENEIEGIASGITGLEACSSAADHPLPLLRSSSPAVVSAPVSPSLLPSVSPPLLTSDVSQGIAGAS